jgi:hypothetical protein
VLDTTRHGDHFNPAIIHAQSDGAPEITADGLTHEGDTMLAEYLPGCHEIPLTHLYGARWRERCEHARPAGQAGGDPSRLGSVGYHQLEKMRHRRLGKLGGIGIRPTQCRRWKQDVGQASDPGLRIVEQDGYATPEALSDQDVVGDPYPQVRHPDDQLAAAHALSR